MSKTKILFHTSQLCLRGTEIAVHDYAQHNEAILGNRSVITFDKNHPLNDDLAIRRFRNRFEVIGYDRFEEVERIIRNEQIDLLYTIKGGKPDGVIATDIPTMVHAVFPTHPRHAHGSAYVYVSEWLARTSANDRLDFVPHIVTLPTMTESLREELGIPEEAVVFGCHGGPESFDLPFVHQVIQNLAQARTNFHFLFLNINAFTRHPRIRFLPGTADVQYKTAFINSCDAMLHGRRKGESFGLACGEFSIRNKPVFTYALSSQRNHFLVLKERGIYYRNARELREKMLRFNPSQMAERDWDCYSAEFAPAPVMRAFQERLIETALARWPSRSYNIRLTAKDQLALLREAINVRVLSIRKRMHV
jgi:hypothetical protein